MTVNAKYSSMDNKYIVLGANTCVTQQLLLALSEHKIIDWFLPYAVYDSIFVTTSFDIYSIYCMSSS